LAAPVVAVAAVASVVLVALAVAVAALRRRQVAAAPCLWQPQAAAELPVRALVSAVGAVLRLSRSHCAAMARTTS